MLLYPNGSMVKYMRFLSLGLRFNHGKTRNEMPGGAAYPRRRAFKRKRGGITAPRVQKMYSRSLARAGSALKIHTFRRTTPNWMQITDTGTGAAAQVQLGYSDWNLAQVPNVTDFTNLFDEYRINYVKLTFFPMFQPAAFAVSGGTGPNPTYPFMAVFDQNDITAAATLEALGEYATCKSFPMQAAPFTIYYRPKILTMVYQSAIATSYVTQPGAQWIATANPSVPHYGFKFGFMGTNTTASSVPVYRVSCEFSISFRFSK